MAEKFEWNGDEPEDTYDPTSVEVDRGRQQGLGMGARDLARQTDPTTPAGASTEVAEDDEAEGDPPKAA